MKINSPRGEMRLDDETNYFVAPAIKCSVNPHSDKIEIQSVEHSQPEWEAGNESNTQSKIFVVVSDDK